MGEVPSVNYIYITFTISLTAFSTRRTFPLDDVFDAKLLRDNNGRLLTNDQRSRVGVRTDVGRANGHVRDFESLNAIHVQARVNDATSLARLHRAGTKLAQPPGNGSAIAISCALPRRTHTTSIDEGGGGSPHATPFSLQVATPKLSL